MSESMIIALVTGLFSLITLVGGPIVAYLLGRGSRKFDEAAKIRDEVWKELQVTRDLNKELSASNSTLTLKLADERADKARLEGELARKILQLEDLVQDLMLENKALRAILKQNGIMIPPNLFREDIANGS